MSNTQEKKIKLTVLENTCYEAVESYGVPCERKSCKKWLDFKQGKNCLMITTQAGPLTLSEIGKIYGLTRMRICQIEKNIYQKIRSFIQ
jgi:hypothetical protein